MIKKYLMLGVSCLVFLSLIGCSGVMAQDAGMIPVMPTQDFLALLLDSIGKIKGASAMTLAVLVTQILLAFFKTPMGEFAGKYKLLAVLVLSLATGILGLMMSGLDWKAALIHSSTLAAFQVLAHQLYVQFVKKSNEAKPSTTT